MATPAFPSSKPLISGPLCLCIPNSPTTPLIFAFPSIPASFIPYIPVSHISRHSVHPVLTLYLVYPCISYFPVSRTTLYLVYPCISYIPVSCIISLYPVYPLISYIAVSRISLYPVQPCISYIPVSRIFLYPVYSCIPFIFDTSILEPIRPLTSLAPVALKQSRCVKILRET